MTFHAQALVRTERPSRYAAQLAKHLGHKVETEWSAEAGFVKLADGVCDMRTRTPMRGLPTSKTS
jgi:hypothetical protein